MNAQAEQMKHVSVTLVNIIGGGSNGGGNGGGRADTQVKKGILGALSTITAKKGTGRDVVPYKKGKELNADQVIPMGKEELKDF